jgi:hypothetical protein
MPDFTLTHGFVEHPESKRFDKARAFGQTNKLIRRNNAELWMAPADERLDAGGRSIPNVNLGFVEKKELISLDGAA